VPYSVTWVHGEAVILRISARGGKLNRVLTYVDRISRTAFLLMLFGLEMLQSVARDGVRHLADYLPTRQILFPHRDRCHVET
jgi:hypothetical protein